MAVGQNQSYHFGAGAPPMLVYFSGDWLKFTGGTMWILTHAHICCCPPRLKQAPREKIKPARASEEVSKPRPKRKPTGSICQGSSGKSKSWGILGMCGSKINHLPGFHFGTGFLSHSHVTVGQNPNRTPSEHQPTHTKIGSKMGGELTYQPNGIQYWC